MDILYGIILGLLVVASVLICVVVLLQKSKSAGLGAAYGSETKTFSQRGKAASKEAKLQKITSSSCTNTATWRGDTRDIRYYS